MQGGTLHTTETVWTESIFYLGLLQPVNHCVPLKNSTIQCI